MGRDNGGRNVGGKTKPEMLEVPFAHNGETRAKRDDGGVCGKSKSRLGMWAEFRLVCRLSYLMEREVLILSHMVAWLVTRDFAWLCMSASPPAS